MTVWTQPYFQHDCGTCRFLGGVDTPYPPLWSGYSASVTRSYDVYRCRAAHEIAGSYVARYGDQWNQSLILTDFDLDRCSLEAFAANKEENWAAFILKSVRTLDLHDALERGFMIYSPASVSSEYYLLSSPLLEHHEVPTLMRVFSEESVRVLLDEYRGDADRLPRVTETIIGRLSASAQHRGMLTRWNASTWCTILQDASVDTEGDQAWTS